MIITQMHCRINTNYVVRHLCVFVWCSKNAPCIFFFGDFLEPGEYAFYYACKYALSAVSSSACCLQCFGVRKSIRPVKNEWWGVDVIVCLERGADCSHMVQLIPLHPKTLSSLASLKSRLVLPFWYRLSQVVLEKKPLNGCNYACK